MKEFSYSLLVKYSDHSSCIHLGHIQNDDIQSSVPRDSVQLCSVFHESVLHDTVTNSLIKHYLRVYIES